MTHHTVFSMRLAVLRAWRFVPQTSPAWPHALYVKRACDKAFLRTDLPWASQGLVS